EGSGNVLVIDHTTDNSLMSFRFRNKDVKMLAAEDDFEANGRKFHAGSFIIPNADRAQLEDSIRSSGFTASALSSTPSVKTHEMDLPRIGYVHSWQRTQDEGWVRAALDYYGVPYTYFADQKLRDGNLRAKYDVIIFPHVGGTSQSQLNGIPKNGPDPIPYKKSDLTPNLGVVDQSDDIRGGMGTEGLAELAKFVAEGGTLITEGSTAALMADYGLASGITTEHPEQLAARGTILRGMFADKKSPITYGYEGKDLPIYFNQDPVFGTGTGSFAAAFSGRGTQNYGQNVTPNAQPVPISPYEPDGSSGKQKADGQQSDESETARQLARAFGGDVEPVHPRIVMQFPANPNDMLLSGMLAGGQALTNRPLVLDAPLGKGHIVLFALRPFWRWQTQGTFFLAFNAILNWNDLDTGKPEPKGERLPTATSGEQ
ncbi:MAG: hypothetical protein JO150_13465, partial [Acidobacteriaceae bacterium]|nr:hypothetical protein [Acidobacteriaceae bacterium]